MSPLRLALLAFTFHGPGVALLGRQPLGAALLRDNVLALAATLAFVLAAVVLAPLTAVRVWVFAAFLVGHFGWGTYLAARVYARTRGADAA